MTNNIADLVSRLEAEIAFVQGDAAAWGVDTYGDLPRTLALLREAAQALTRIAGELDTTELDMIQRGDMLGPKLGAKVHAALERLEAENAMLRRDGAPLQHVRRIAMGTKPGDVIEVVSLLSPEFTKKEVYNAVTYLARRGELSRVGYGRYTPARTALAALEPKP